MNLHADSSDVKDYENIRDFFRQSPTVPLESIVPTLPTSQPAQQIQHRLQDSYKENYNATLWNLIYIYYLGRKAGRGSIKLFPEV